MGGVTYLCIEISDDNKGEGVELAYFRSWPAEKTAIVIAR
jgi:hypothetical protein